MQWIPVLTVLFLFLLPVLKTFLTPAARPFQTGESFVDQLTSAAKQPAIKCFRPLKIRRGTCAVLRKNRSSPLPADQHLSVCQLLCENRRYLLEEARRSTKGIPPLPSTDGLQPRVCLFARALISTAQGNLSSADIRQALQIWQEEIPLCFDELWALPAVLRIALIEYLSHLCADYEHSEEQAGYADEAIRSFRALETMPWNELLEVSSLVHKVLQTDPVYNAMTSESRTAMRRRIARIARNTHLNETAVAAAAVELCRGKEEKTPEIHTGYYLWDDGYSELLVHLQAMTPMNRIRCLCRQHAFGIGRFARWLTFLLILVLAWRNGLSTLFWLPAAHVFILPFLRSRSVPFRPRIELDHLSEEDSVLVVLPARLSSTSDAIAAVKQLSIMHLANPDPQLHFLLLGDFPSTAARQMASDTEILSAASQAVSALVQSSGHPFFYLQRERGSAEGTVLQAILSLTAGEPTTVRLAHASVDPAALCRHYRYVILTEPGMLLPPGSALKMIGAMMYPLHRWQKRSHQTRGTAVFQPTLAFAPHAKESRFSSLLTVETPLHDCQHSLFSGIGIIDPYALRPDVDFIAPGVCAALGDVTLCVRPAITLREALCSRFGRIQHFLLALFQAQLSLESRSLLWRSLLDLLCAPAQLLMLVVSIVSVNGWLYGLVLLTLFFSTGSFSASLLRIAMLPCDAFTALSAFVRTLYHRLTGLQLPILRGSPADPYERPSDRPPMLFFTILMICAGVFAALPLLTEAPMMPCWLTAGLWVMFACFLPMLERSGRQGLLPTAYMRETLLRIARRTLLFFETAITDADHHLPVQSVQIDPNTGIDHSVSPDTIGLYLCALLCARQLELLSSEETLKRMDDCTDTLLSLPKWNGLPFERYDTRTLEPAPSGSIRSAQCGILAVSLLTCAQGIRAMLPKADETHMELAAKLDRIAEEMQLRHLYDSSAKLFYKSIQPGSNHSSSDYESYLASPSQLVSFAAIMLGQINEEHWFNLNRCATTGGALLSPSGGMADDLLSALFEPMLRSTLLSHSRLTTIRCQRRKRHSGVYGVSESACMAFDPDLRYQVRSFGLPSLSADEPVACDVVTPYACMLSLPFDLKRGFINLQRLSVLGMEGPLGLFEALDFSKARNEGRVPSIVRSHVSKHQAIILCAICNTLHDQYLSRLFSSLPRFQAYRLLLEEPQRAAQKQSRRLAPDPLPEQFIPISAMKREAHALCFPVDAHVLHSASTSWLIDAQGGGCLMREGVAITRFEESCCVSFGPRIYLRDSQNGACWMPTDPHLTQEISFEPAQVVFSHTFSGLSCKLCLWLSPLDGSAVQSLTIENSSSADRMIEACSFWEPDVSIQAVQRICCHGLQAVSERFVWQHMLVADDAPTLTRILCDRTAFLGRGHSALFPRAMGIPISAIADQLHPSPIPCFSVRGQFVLPAGQTLRMSFVTRIFSKDEHAASFCSRYADPSCIERIRLSALTAVASSLRFWDLQEEEWGLLSRLTGVLAYTDQPFQGGTQPFSFEELENFGLNYSCRLLLVECTAEARRDTIAQLLKAHAYWHDSGFPFTLVFMLRVRTRASAVRDMVEQEIARNFSRQHVERPNGVFVIERANEEEQTALRAAARLIIQADQEIPHQLDALHQSMDQEQLFFCRLSEQNEPALPSAEEPAYFNGFGGFIPSGYQIILSPTLSTPSPWRNPIGSVIADESGIHGGCEAIFLRDEDRRLLWSPTRLPLGQLFAYRITHSPGETIYESIAHGISARIVCFACEEERADVRLIHLCNKDTSQRTLRLFHQRALKKAHLRGDKGVVSGWDSISGRYVCLFTSETDGVEGAAMSAGSFHGLCGNIPYALAVDKRLPNTGGSCAVLSHAIHLPPNGRITIAFFTLSAENEKDMEKRVRRLRSCSASELLHLERQRWEERLSLFQADLPDTAAALLFSCWIPYQFQHLWLRSSPPALIDLFPMVYTEPKRMQKLLAEAGRRRDQGSLFEQILLPLLCARCSLISGEPAFLKGDLLIRCVRNLLGIPLGAHGMPVAEQETVWLGMFLCEAIRMLLPFCAPNDREALSNRRSGLLQSIDRHAWNGEWYLSGWSETGEPVGANASANKRIDLATQSWAVMCGVSRERCEIAMENALRTLFAQETVGSASVPGTLTVFWAVSALHQLGQNERAWGLLRSRLPVGRSSSRQAAHRYQAEPYALAMEISPSGRGSNVWASGTGWCWCIWLEELLGFRLRGSVLRFTPVVLAEWNSLQLTFRFGSSIWHLHAKANQELPSADGQVLAQGKLRLAADNRIHEAIFPLRS